jgi:hypothetical protein
MRRWIGAARASASGSAAEPTSWAARVTFATVSFDLHEFLSSLAVARRYPAASVVRPTWR